MAQFDLYGACNRMAVLLAAVSPPSGVLVASTIRKAYGQAPNNTPMLPCCVVTPQSGSLVLAPGAYNGDHEVDVLFLIQQASGDLARIETDRQKWLPVLYHAFDGDMDLGYAGTVNKVYPTGYDFDEITYGGVAYDGITLHYRLSTFESGTLTP